MAQMFPRLRLKGAPFEIGRQHGAELLPRIRENIKTYFGIFSHYASLDRTAVLNRAESFIPIIEAFDRDLMEELRGIADGSQTRLEEIVALNSRTEIMFKEGSPPACECTSMAATPEVTANGHTFIGQNWDWMVGLRENCVLLEIEQRSKPRVLTFTEAGFAGKIGLNSAGVGLCCNLLVTSRVRPGVPFHMLCRGVLNSGSLGEALGKLLTAKSGVGGNFLVGHADGEAVDLEVTPDGSDYLYGQGGILTHTNHFESRLIVDDQGRKLLPDSIVRYRRSAKLLGRASGKIGFDSFRSVFIDHFNRPSAICRHPDEKLPEPERIQTNASIVMDLTERKMMICYGNPCQGEYQTVQLSQ